MSKPSAEHRHLKWFAARSDAEKKEWCERAGSTRPIDAWRAWKKSLRHVAGAGFGGSDGDFVRTLCGLVFPLEDSPTAWEMLGPEPSAATCEECLRRERAMRANVR